MNNDKSMNLSIKVGKIDNNKDNKAGVTTFSKNKVTITLEKAHLKRKRLRAIIPHI